jgi:hypothetical protein
MMSNKGVPLIASEEAVTISAVLGLRSSRPNQNGGKGRRLQQPGGIEILPNDPKIHLKRLPSTRTDLQISAGTSGGAATVTQSYALLGKNNEGNP